MAFWSRLKQPQLKTLSNQIQRCYLRAYCTSNSSNHSALHSRTGIATSASFDVRRNQFQLQNHVRFFGTKVKAKKKENKEENDTSGPRLNENITAQYVRLVTDEGHNVVSRHEALSLATRLKLDLVEVQRNAQPPVCKLMDYHKVKYKQQIQEKERSSKTKTDMKKTIVKEVRFSGLITQKDLQLKADTVKRLLEEGYRVKCTVKALTGKKASDPANKKAEDLEELLSRFMPLIEDFSIVESGPIVEVKQAHVLVRHVKLGASKKSGKKVADSVVDNSQEDASSGASSYSEDAYGVVSADASADNSKNWSVSGSRDDSDHVFDVRDGNNFMRNSSEEAVTTRPQPLVSPANRSLGPSPPIGLAGSHNASTTTRVPVGTENRYTREPSSDSPVQPTNRYGPSAPKTRLRPPSEAQFNTNAAHQRHEDFQQEARPSRFGNANSFSEQNSPGSSHTAQSFGNYAPNAGGTSVKQNASPVFNRYKQGNVSDSARSSTHLSAGRSPNEGQGTDNDGQEKKFGLFSQ